MWKKIFILVLGFMILTGCSDQNNLIPTPTLKPTKTPMPTVNPEILEINSGKQQSQKILKAIENYYEDNKIYPT